MNWRRILARHRHVDKTRTQCRVRNVRGCQVDMRSCPAPNIVIDVDDCETESTEFADALTDGKKCDLVLLYGEVSSVGVLFVEVKNTRYGAQISRGIEQIIRSRIKFDELTRASDPEITTSAYYGVLVSNHTRRSSALRTKLRGILREHSILLGLVGCGEDIWIGRWT